MSPNTLNFPSKRLTAGEVAEAAENRFWMGSVWEVMGDAVEMSAAVGKTHGSLATQVALSVGQPAGSSIAFAVDYDAPPSDFGKISAYFAAVHAACREDGYLTTGYGSEAVVSFLLKEGLIHFQWLAGAAGWSESRFASGEAIEQTNTGNVSVAGIPVDLDLLSGGFAEDPARAGLWLPQAGF